MTKPTPPAAIRLRGVRHNNLKNFDLDLPLGQLIVITGLSGSGKSSLAFDTLFAEGQRRYIETFSPYARQFFDRMDKPQVDKIEGIPPAIAIEQRNTVKTTRSTIGTMTELCDYMKLLWSHLARLYCRQCRQPVRKEPPQLVWETINAESGMPEAECLITFTVALSAKLSLGESLALIAKQGYQRLLVNQEIIRVDEATAHDAFRVSPSALTVVQDRLRLIPANRARCVEACEQAYHFGKGRLEVHPLAPERGDTSRLMLRAARPFSAHLHCARCDLEYREPSPALFSFNHPLGACPTCRGFGRIISIDCNLAIPDRAKTLAEGAVKPWQTGHGLESQADLMKFCKVRKVPIDVPFARLPQHLQDWVIDGDPGYGQDAAHEWPRAWYGVKGYFRWLESKAYKMHVRVLLSRYRTYSTCPDCQGQRFQPEALLYRFQLSDAQCSMLDASTLKAAGFTPPSITLADFYALPIRTTLQLIDAIGAQRPFRPSDPLSLILSDVRSRLSYLVDVGLGYLTLDRPTRTLSGGETERVSLTTCLGTRLVNTLYVLDEPSVGLHARDTARLVRLLEKLRDLGNTVLVVEHEASIMRAADQIVDLGPGRGEAGGQVIYQGPFKGLLQSTRSLTGQYLSGAKQLEPSARRSVPVEQSRRPSRTTAEYSISAETLELRESVPPYRVEPNAAPMLRLAHATRHNLNDLTVDIPLNRFVCLTGVSGSGKTTLAREVLLPALEAHLKPQNANLGSDEEPSTDDEAVPPGMGQPPSALLTGHEHLSRAILVNQSPIGKTPRSNPVVYIGAFEDIRELFAQTDLATQRGLTASAFSFNSTQGQCERCRGAGFEKIEMQFLSDVYIRCPDCQGRRYRPHILEVKLPVTAPQRVTAERGSGTGKRRSVSKGAPRSSTDWSIADLLEATADEAIPALSTYTQSPHGRRALQRLALLQEVGLGYLRLGQPINTLSGGESQRLKLVSHVAEAASTAPRATSPAPRSSELVLPSGPSGVGRESARSANPKLETPNAKPPVSPTLFLFDEPTTGLHFDDIRVLLRAFQRLVDSGHSLLVIEHNLDVIRSADWVIDLGPEAGDGGGQIVAQGRPEDIAACAASHTGRALREAH